MRAPEFCIGLMSGTSLDGVDGVLARWSGDRDDAFETRSFTHRAFAPALHDELLALNRAGADEIHRAALAANALARDCAAAVSDLLEQAGVAVTPGIGFGEHGEGYFRISLTYPDDVLAQAMQRLAEHLR